MMKDSQAIVTPLGVSASTIKLDSPEWFDWLKERSSFSYQSAISDYTCNKRSNGKWYASKRKGDRSQGSKTLAQEYLGAGDKVTKTKLEEIARKFALPDRDYWYLKHPKPKTGEPTASPGAGCTTGGTTKSKSSSQTLDGVTRWNVYERAKGWNSTQKAYAWSEWQWVGSWEAEEKADSQIQTRKEHNHRKNSMSDYGVVPMEWEKRLEIISPVTQSHSGNYATSRETSSQVSDEIAELKAEIARLTQELKCEAEISQKNFQERTEMWERYQQAHLKNQQIQAELDSRCQQLALKSQECSELLAKLETRESHKQNCETAQESLDEFLKLHPKVADHLNDTRRYRAGEDLAKFKAWLESRES